MKPQAQVEYRPIKDLKELRGNPRTIKKDQFEKLKQSIKDNADYFEARPIILSDRTGEWQGRHVTVLCDGCHQAWEAKVNRIRSLR